MVSKKQSKVSKKVVKEKKPLIGFIGQGFVGSAYADDFEQRGFPIVRYQNVGSLAKNKSNIKKCDIVFIAVPTPTTKNGFDDSIIRTVMPLVGKGKIAVIKSTIVIGTTKHIQKQHPNIFVFHSPEFLTEATAPQDAAHPKRNIIGIPKKTGEYKKKAKFVLSVLPKAPFELICDSNEAELIKYGGNNWFFFKVLFINLLYDVAQNSGASWDVIRAGMAEDPRIGFSHMTPVHKSGTLGGDSYRLHPQMSQKGERGAGGHCFIKDYASFVIMYEKFVGDDLGMNVLRALEKKNIDLLTSTGKDLDLLEGVYGE